MPSLLTEKIYFSSGGQVKDLVRSNNWEVAITNFEGGDIAIYAATATFPNLQVTPYEVAHMNEKVKYAGGPIEQVELSLSLYDDVDDKMQSGLYQWYKKIYDPDTGKIGLASDYKKNGFLYQYTPAGEELRKWEIFGMFPTSIDHGGEGDYTNGEGIKIACTISVDKWKLS